jgi:hypothetical protein
MAGWQKCPRSIDSNRVYRMHVVIGPMLSDMRMFVKELSRCWNLGAEGVPVRR